MKEVKEEYEEGGEFREEEDEDVFVSFLLCTHL